METKWFAHAFCAEARTDLGKKRRVNEDRVVCCPELGVYAVLDGMGGLSGGEAAAELAAQFFPKLLTAAHEELQKDPSLSRAAGLLKEGVRILSDGLYDALNHKGQPVFGTTLCGLWLVGQGAVFVNLGDSRGYHFCQGNLRQITKDHNWAGVLVERGELTAQEARLHPGAAALTRFVGMKGPAQPEVFAVELQKGHRLLLCSDGLYGMTEDFLIASILRANPNPREAVEALINAANLAGGNDNMGIVCVEIGEGFGGLS